jgi:hypothetical protein
MIFKKVVMTGARRVYHYLRVLMNCVMTEHAGCMIRSFDIQQKVSRFRLL